MRRRLDLSILKKIAISLFVLFVVVFFYLWGEPPEARKSIMQSFTACLKPSVSLSCGVDVKDIKEIWISAPSHLPYSDQEKNGYYIYSNPKKIKKLMNYFCNLKLTTIAKEEARHNRTPDSYVVLHLKNGKEYSWLSVYADEFIQTSQSSANEYKMKKGNIMDPIKKLDLGK